jgi:hypothetical protein
MLAWQCCSTALDVYMQRKQDAFIGGCSSPSKQCVAPQVPTVPSDTQSAVPTDLCLCLSPVWSREEQLTGFSLFNSQGYTSLVHFIYSRHRSVPSATEGPSGTHTQTRVRVLMLTQLAPLPFASVARFCERNEQPGLWKQAQKKRYEYALPCVCFYICHYKKKVKHNSGMGDPGLKYYQMGGGLHYGQIPFHLGVLNYWLNNN